MRPHVLMVPVLAVFLALALGCKGDDGPDIDDVFNPDSKTTEDSKVGDTDEPGDDTMKEVEQDNAQPDDDTAEEDDGTVADDDGAATEDDGTVATDDGTEPAECTEDTDCDDNNPCTEDICTAEKTCQNTPIDSEEMVTCGVGKCLRKVKKCTNGVENECVPGTPAEKEQCDGTDDDCDGVTDPPDSVGCQVYYRDSDKDGFGDPNDSACLCGPTEEYPTREGGDCCDTDARTHPDVTEFFTEANACGSFDYNCDEEEQKQHPEVIQCIRHSETECETIPETGGWNTTIPECGEYAAFIPGCEKLSDCLKSPSVNKNQACN